MHEPGVQFVPRRRLAEENRMTAKRVYLSESEMPTAWYNLLADLPEPLPPPLNPGTASR